MSTTKQTEEQAKRKATTGILEDAKEQKEGHELLEDDDDFEEFEHKSNYSTVNKWIYRPR